MENFDLIKRIIKNSNELALDSLLLYNNQRYKRAFFLIYTAFEETVKAEILLSGNPNSINLSGHGNKSELAQSVYLKLREKLGVKSMKESLKRLKNDLNISKSVDYEKIGLNVRNEDYEKFEKTLTEEFYDFYKIGGIVSLRSLSLYVDGSIGEKLSDSYYLMVYRDLNSAHIDLLVKLKESHSNLFNE